MNRTILSITIAYTIFFSDTVYSQGVDTVCYPTLKGPYLGQKLPGNTPEVFAPSIVNFGLTTRDIAISEDGKEIYFRVGLPGFSRTAILEVREIDGRWTEPEVSSFSSDPRWRNLEPCLSPDGKEFFFSSNRPANPASDKPGPFNIWGMKRIANRWSEPLRLNDSINGSDGTFFPSVTKDGTLYYGREGKDGLGEIWRVKKGKDGYLSPEKLPKQVNAGESRYNPFVAPDENYVILPIYGLKDTHGGMDYYIVFRNPDDTWCEPINLGSVVNTPTNGEISLFVSRDNRNLFFCSSRVKEGIFSSGEKLTLKKFKEIARESGANGDQAIYWVSTEFLEKLRPENFKK